MLWALGPSLGQNVKIIARPWSPPLAVGHSWLLPDLYKNNQIHSQNVLVDENTTAQEIVFKCQSCDALNNYDWLWVSHPKIPPTWLIKPPDLPTYLTQCMYVVHTCLSDVTNWHYNWDKTVSQMLNFFYFFHPRPPYVYKGHPFEIDCPLTSAWGIVRILIPGSRPPVLVYSRKNWNGCRRHFDSPEYCHV